MAIVKRGRNFKVTLDLESLQRLGDPRKVFDSNTQDRLGGETVDAIKERVTNGLSPVRGVARYPGYAQTRTRKPNSYPASVKDRFPAKKTRPVNLTLSGEFLRRLTFRPERNGVSIGWFNVDARTKALIETHQEGLNPNVPRRQVLPTGSGEEFVRSINRLIKNIVLRRISRIINSG